MEQLLQFEHDMNSSTSCDYCLLMIHYSLFSLTPHPVYLYPYSRRVLWLRVVSIDGIFSRKKDRCACISRQIKSVPPVLPRLGPTSGSIKMNTAALLGLLRFLSHPHEIIRVPLRSLEIF